MAGYTGSWTDSVGGEVADAYTFNAGNAMDGWSGFFGDALGAYVGLESLKIKSEATGAGQEATRSGVTTPTGTAAYQGSGGGMGGVSPQMLMVGGLLAVAAFMVLK